MKVKLFIAVVPRDYTHADVDVFQYRSEAEAFIEECSPRDKNYCFIREQELEVTRLKPPVEVKGEK